MVFDIYFAGRLKDHEEIKDRLRLQWDYGSFLFQRFFAQGLQDRTCNTISI